MVYAFVALDHRPLEKSLNEEYLGVFRIGTHDHGFGYLFGGIGGANDVETTIAQLASYVAGQSTFVSAVEHFDGYLAGFQLPFVEALINARLSRRRRNRLQHVGISPPGGITEHAEQEQQGDRGPHDAEDPTDHR
jgi:hypothetical protein